MTTLTLPSLSISDTQKVSTPIQLNAQSLKKTPITPIIQPGNSGVRSVKPTFDRANRRLSISIIDPNNMVNSIPKPSLPSSLGNTRAISNKERRQKSEDKEKDVGNRTTLLKRTGPKKATEDAENLLDKTLRISQYKNWNYMKEYLVKHREKLAENKEQEKLANDRKFGEDFSYRMVAAKKKFIARLEGEQKKELPKIKLTAIDSELARPEDRMFFNVLEDYVQNKTNSLSFIERTPSQNTQNTEPQEEENNIQNVVKFIKRGKNIPDKTLWLDKTSQIKQEINEYTSRQDEARELLDFSQEVIEDQTNRIKLRYEKINQNFGSKGPEMNEADRKDAMRDAQDWNEKVFSVFKSASTRSKSNKKDRHQFFQMMILKQQKAAHKTMMQALDPKPRSKNTSLGERDLFSGGIGSIVGKLFAY